MGEPAESLPDDDRADAVKARPSFARADWLVGADEGLGAEFDRAKGESHTAPLTPPRLVRPGATAPPVVPTVGAPKPLPSATPSDRAALPSWDAGASSVPMMPRAPKVGVPDLGAIPELGRDFPMDDAEERAATAARVAEEQAHAAELAARPHELVRPDEFAVPEAAAPWWTDALGALRTDRRIQGAVLAVVLAVAAFALWPREGNVTSLRSIKANPERFVDTEVRVSGRVSEVFPVGGSWAYTLVQGRDTIAVFTRAREPQARERIEVVGTVSRGWLGGESRVAIFESNSR